MSKLAERGTEWILRREPLSLALGLFSYSMILVFLGAPAADVWDFPGRATGYSQTLNWAWGFTLVVPWAAFFAVRAGHLAEELPARLVKSGMLLDRDLAPVTSAAPASQRWTSIRRRYASWWLFVTGVGCLETLGEWAMTSAIPLATGAAPAGDEWDWAVRHVGADPRRAFLNGAFSLLAFAQQAVLISLIAYLVYLSIAVSAYLSDLRKPERAQRLFPSLDLCGKDKRLGFEGLAPFFESFLLASVLVYVELFLSRTWNAFLNPEPGEEHGSAWEMIRGALRLGAESRQNGGGDLGETVLWALDSVGASNFSGLAVSMGGVALLVLCLAILVLDLRRLVADARDELAETPRGRKRAQCLAEMAIWPLRYPSVTALFGLALLGALSLAAYRLGLFFVGLAIPVCVTWAVAVLRR